MKRNKLIKWLVIFLVRRRLKLKKFERFTFTNQKTDAVYYFATYKLMKIENGLTFKSSVSLNWLLNDECEIERVTE
jgi:hypothetical protein